MWILDQSKSNIVNCDRVINIGLEEESTLTDETEITVQTDGYSVILGRYETEERAIEVLEDIVYMIQCQNDDVYFEKQEDMERQFYTKYEKKHQDRVFKMPEK